MIYLASPYTDPDREVMEQRYDQVAEETARLLNLGHVIYSPIVHCHNLANRFHLPRDFGFWRSYNLGMVSAARSLWIFAMPGWEESRGVTAEIEFAQRVGKFVRVGGYNGEDYRHI